MTGFEPVTLRLSSACSNQLSYTPKWLMICGWRITTDLAASLKITIHKFSLVELRRLELLTYSLQSYRSTN